jgi:glycosyltransferase involved in cell wall biosynthesis
MRILFCNYEYPPLGGGGGVINADLAEELARTHSVTVLTSRAMDLASDETVSGVRVIRAPVMGRSMTAAANMLSMATFLPSGYLRGRNLLRKEKFDIINTHFVLPTGPLGARLADFARIPNVLTVHGGDLFDPSKASSPHRHALLRAAIRRLLKRASVVVGQSKNTIENVHQFYTPDLDCKLIPLGIKRPADTVARKADHGFAPGDTILVTVGRLVRRKANDQLIEMIANIEDPSVRLLIIGDGPLREELQELAEARNVSDRVVFAGFVSEKDKQSLLAISDLYVSTSQHEGFGLVFLEAMAAGLPVICYDFGGQTDFLEDGLTGALIPLNEQDQFLQACRSWLGSPDKMANSAQENLGRVESYFIDNCAARYEALFEETVKAFWRD